MPVVDAGLMLSPHPLQTLHHVVFVVVRIHHLQKSGVDKIIFFINFGGIEHRKVLDSLDLFAKEVMPNFIE